MNRYKSVKEVKGSRNVFSRRKGYESPDSDGDDYDGRDSDVDIVLKNIRRPLRAIEEELEYKARTLQSAARVLRCTAACEELDDPRTVDILTRVYSPTTPTYVDVHFFYHCRGKFSYSSIGRGLH